MLTDLIFNHIPLLILVSIVGFVALSITIFIGNITPTYSFWYKLANKLDKFANIALLLLGIIFFGELLMIIYVFTQLFKYGGN